MPGIVRQALRGVPLWRDAARRLHTDVAADYDPRGSATTHVSSSCDGCLRHACLHATLLRDANLGDGGGRAGGSSSLTPGSAAVAACGTAWLLVHVALRAAGSAAPAATEYAALAMFAAERVAFPLLLLYEASPLQRAELAAEVAVATGIVTVLLPFSSLVGDAFLAAAALWWLQAATRRPPPTGDAVTGEELEAFEDAAAWQWHVHEAAAVAALLLATAARVGGYFAFAAAAAPAAAPAVAELISAAALARVANTFGAVALATLYLEVFDPPYSRWARGAALPGAAALAFDLPVFMSVRCGLSFVSSALAGLSVAAVVALAVVQHWAGVPVVTVAASVLTLHHVTSLAGVAGVALTAARWGTAPVEAVRRFFEEAPTEAMAHGRWLAAAAQSGEVLTTHRTTLTNAAVFVVLYGVLRETATFSIAIVAEAVMGGAVVQMAVLQFFTVVCQAPDVADPDEANDVPPALAAKAAAWRARVAEDPSLVDGRDVAVCQTPVLSRDGAYLLVDQELTDYDAAGWTRTGRQSKRSIVVLTGIVMVVVNLVAAGSRGLARQGFSGALQCLVMSNSLRFCAQAAWLLLASGAALPKGAKSLDEIQREMDAPLPQRPGGGGRRIPKRKMGGAKKSR
jgi:hypothetical protein